MSNEKNGEEEKQPQKQSMKQFSALHTVFVEYLPFEKKEKELTNRCVGRLNIFYKVAPSIFYVIIKILFYYFIFLHFTLLCIFL